MTFSDLMKAQWRRGVYQPAAFFQPAAFLAGEAELPSQGREETPQSLFMTS